MSKDAEPKKINYRVLMADEDSTGYVRKRTQKSRYPPFKTRVPKPPESCGTSV